MELNPIGRNYGRFSEYRTGWRTRFREGQEPDRTREDWEAGTTAIASWPKEPVFSTCWSTVNSSFSPCSVRSKLQVPEEGPAGQAQATVLLSGYFEKGERKALANLASVLGGGHLELLSFYVTQSVPLHPQKEICVLLGWIKCV